MKKSHKALIYTTLTLLTIVITIVVGVLLKDNNEHIYSQEYKIKPNKDNTIDFNGELQIIIPKGALNEKINLSVKEDTLRKIQPFKQTVCVGKVYEFSSQKFNKPVTIQLDLGDYLHPNETYIGRFDGYKWEKLETSYDTTIHKLVAKTDHFSTFSTFINDEPPMYEIMLNKNDPVKFVKYLIEEGEEPIWQTVNFIAVAAQIMFDQKFVRRFGYLLMQSPEYIIDLISGGFINVGKSISKDALLEIVKKMANSPDKASINIAIETMREGYLEYAAAYIIAQKYRKKNIITEEEALMFIKYRFGYHKIGLGRILYSKSENYKSNINSKVSKELSDIAVELLDNKYSEFLGANNEIPVLESALFLVDVRQIMKDSRVGLENYKPYTDFEALINKMNKERIDEFNKLTGKDNVDLYANIEELKNNEDFVKKIISLYYKEQNINYYGVEDIKVFRINPKEPESAYVISYSCNIDATASESYQSVVLFASKILCNNPDFENALGEWSIEKLGIGKSSFSFINLDNDLIPEIYLQDIYGARMSWLDYNYLFKLEPVYREYHFYYTMKKIYHKEYSGNLETEKVEIKFEKSEKQNSQYPAFVFNEKYYEAADYKSEKKLINEKENEFIYINGTFGQLLNKEMSFNKFVYDEVFYNSIDIYWILDNKRYEAIYEDQFKIESVKAYKFIKEYCKQTKQDGSDYLLKSNLEKKVSVQFLIEFLGEKTNKKVLNVKSLNDNISQNNLKETTDDIVVKGTLYDKRDGKTYKTVKIGNQVWMAKNLSYKARHGCFAYDNDQSNVTKYGYLYNWETAKTVCPSGWHLPTKAEFKTLLNNYGGGSGDKTNYIALISGGESGFSASFGGWSSSGFYGAIRRYGYYWSSSTKDDKYAWNLYILSSDYKEAGMVNFGKRIGLSIRCLKN